MKNILSIAMSALLLCSMLASCKKEPKETLAQEQTPIPINVSTSLWTKVTDNGYEENDKVGIYVVNWSDDSQSQFLSSGNHADNAGFTFSGGVWMPDDSLYWLDQSTKADFYCYYPYVESVVDVASFPFSVNLDQSTDAGYKSSDLLWGKTEGVSPTPDPVEIMTNHLMSNLLIYLQPGKGYSEETFAAAQKSVSVTGVLYSANVNLATGEVIPVGEPSDLIPKPEDGYYRVLIVPQFVVDAPLVRVVINGDEYTLNQSIDFESNRQYKCTVTVNRTGEGVDIGIGDWIVDDDDYGGVVE